MLWLSLGENCLPNEILNRFYLRSYSTPFSSGRSNIDYLLALEQKKYEGLLDPENLYHIETDSIKVVKSKIYNQCSPIFAKSVSEGFEFTHHDVLDNKKHRKAIKRRIDRMLSIRGERNICFLYYHRPSLTSNLEELTAKLNQFAQIYSNEKAESFVVLFTQKKLTSVVSQKRLEFLGQNKRVLTFLFHTHHLWEGNDQDIFWARIDDDLIALMFKEVFNKIKIDFGLKVYAQVRFLQYKNRFYKNILFKIAKKRIKLMKFNFF